MVRADADPVRELLCRVIVGQPVAKGFGKTDSFAIGLGVLPFIFYPILGFGPDRWQGSGDSAAA